MVQPDLFFNHFFCFEGREGSYPCEPNQNLQDDLTQIIFWTALLLYCCWRLMDSGGWQKTVTLPKCPWLLQITWSFDNDEDFQKKNLAQYDMLHIYDWDMQKWMDCGSNLNLSIFDWCWQGSQLLYRGLFSDREGVIIAKQ